MDSLIILVLGMGPRTASSLPEGHPMEVLWEIEYYQVPPEKRSLLRNRPQKRPLRGSRCGGWTT